MSLLNPLAIRIPLFDPEGFLALTMPLMRPVYSIFGLLAWVGLVIYGISLAVINWDGLTQNVADRLLSAESIALLLIVYPVVKAFHELGHAYAIKRWGGEVHEIGIMMLVFMPVPYVDASDSLSFQSKWQRAFVAGAGIMVELMLAAIAMIVWDNAESGLVRAFAFNVMLIGGVSTLFFNGNPLLRFDGYYVLSDLIEIPNLGRRANQYIGYLLQKYLLGVEEPRNPATAPGEGPWMAFYAIAAFLYRLFIFSVIVLLVATQFFFIGVFLAIWTLILMFGWPILKHTWFLLTSPLLRRSRGKALSQVAVVLVAVLAFLAFQPFPHATIAEGVTLLPGEATIQAEVDGTVVEVLAPPGTEVAQGDPLIMLEDPLLAVRVQILQATVAELRRRVDAARATDPNRTRIAREDLAAAQAELDLALERQDNLTVRAGTSGVVALSNAADLPGRFIRQGVSLGYVTSGQDPVIRAVVRERDADLVQGATTGLQARFASDLTTTRPATIMREVPALSGALPSQALATEGGGRIVLDQNQAALENLLHLEVALPDGTPFAQIGERVYLRFSHPPASLAERSWRRLRQVFLEQFEI